MRRVNYSMQNRLRRCRKGLRGGEEGRGEERQPPHVEGSALHYHMAVGWASERKPAAVALCCFVLTWVGEDGYSLPFQANYHYQWFTGRHGGWKESILYFVKFGNEEIDSNGLGSAAGENRLFFYFFSKSAGWEEGRQAGRQAGLLLLSNGVSPACSSLTCASCNFLFNDLGG